ncbi:protein of unknown function [Cupriavidus neocaledonicus]|uniref:Uncharacterized protein n=1 Tax=Cupriavidus neocaledonicus TaxID=1040979 RepID=A0A375HBZ8_9BURK|nr:hypothetical protein CBM2605_A230212 [Cupriavidus neocaledonicus]SPD47923.1 protein of unknown function [Cupriavidus neocaledonicus]
MDCEAAEGAGGRLGRDPVIEWMNNCILRRAAAGTPSRGERAADSRTSAMGMRVDGGCGGCGAHGEVTGSGAIMRHFPMTNR